LRNVLDGPSAAAHPASQDEIFFRALRAYLTAYRAQAVGTGDLLTILQRTTGQDLRWFFDEWVYNAGCPHYLVTASYDADAKLERVKIVQTQDTAGVPRTFVMPIELDFYGAGGESKQARIQNRARSQEFQIPLAFRPQ